MRDDAFRSLTHANKMFDFVAMRKPVIISRTLAVEACFSDQAMLFFEAGDVPGLASRIRELHSDPGLRQSLAERAWEESRPYSWPEQQQRYLAAVERLLGPDSRD
jgi:hypothetical protein